MSKQPMSDHKNFLAINYPIILHIIAWFKSQVVKYADKITKNVSLSKNLRTRLYLNGFEKDGNLLSAFV